MYNYKLAEVCLPTGRPGCSTMNETILSDNRILLPFSCVTLNDRETVARYMTKYGENSCQHSFTALFTLSEKYGSKICEKDGFLFTLREGLCTEGKRVYLAPMGGGDLKGAYSAILADSAACNCRAVFNTLTEEHAAFLKKAFPGRFTYTELRDYAEYIYLSDSLCKFAGKRFADKRNKINKLLRIYGERLTVRLLSPEDIPDILRFEERWVRDNAASHDRIALEQEMRAIRIQLDNFEALGISGAGIRIDGEMVAFAYGIPLNDNCFDGLIAKARSDIPSLYKLLYRKISCLCAAPYTYFNWEEDIGIPGLRNAKSEYGPAILMKKYLVQEKDALCELS